MDSQARFLNLLAGFRRNRVSFPPTYRKFDAQKLSTRLFFHAKAIDPSLFFTLFVWQPRNPDCIGGTEARPGVVGVSAHRRPTEAKLTSPR